MVNSRLIWVLYYLMALIVVLPGALYLSRRVPFATKVFWGLVWVGLFLCCLILYPYVLPVLKEWR